MNPGILALDFDGVLCDGLKEYLDSTSKAYETIWHDKLTIDDPIRQNFYRLRPVIETGWEMPVLLRAIALGYDPETILNSWFLVRDEIVEKEKLDKKSCAKALDSVRDTAIKLDLASWLGLHRFYDGVVARLNRILDSETIVYIVTTKEGRFVAQLLKQAGIELPPERIIGKEVKRPKYETIRLIAQENHINARDIWFVEDRLEALKLVRKQPDLYQVKLFLAQWGYNTEKERQIATKEDYLQLLHLSQFSQDFVAWLD